MPRCVPLRTCEKKVHVHANAYGHRPQMHNKKARVCIIWNALWCALIGITALCMYIPIVLAELQVANKDLVVDICSENARPEKVDTVQVGDVHTPTRRKTVYMYMHV